ncbi:hypothetical protein Q0A17_03650 [Citrobacter sp. S2-9]|uniref:Uncharacterized protein n=1 Tax=Citrobacter enshiensis TaxID=2971264 RepID=A0ABT8PQA3_9ENTR|nr:hypothetical protein [Citrobacter enshiensis]MDN8598514.1 hypothetical protein [Citrobacter enshiensis]
MNSDELQFYEDDEGITVDLILQAFGPDPVQCINLESEFADQKMKDDIDFLVKRQNDFYQIINAEAKQYCARVYGASVNDLTLVKIYLSPEDKSQFGFMLATSLDPEHGLGFKFHGIEMKKTGSSETAFL